ncbi:hypothetical protein Isop_0075 [Isosphaera pallida ATCC 43644]|uniref:Uncharacterized protein n=1 Tax=Isosphaera pallida (strain ATCC 43644 / DSM 9630 / IS1B) TaxID=575540 RepID=E8R5D1_ISOPI|nr:hypothetical protein Isop_0075 [Isosphaera pallida ATCC 43644]
MFLDVVPTFETPPSKPFPKGTTRTAERDEGGWTTIERKQKQKQKRNRIEFGRWSRRDEPEPWRGEPEVSESEEGTVLPELRDQAEHRHCLQESINLFILFIQ